MKRTTQLDALRTLDPTALARKITELEHTRDRARLDAQFGSVKNHQALGVIRRRLAQAKTIQHARQTTYLEPPSTRLSLEATAGPAGSRQSGKEIE